MRLIFADPGLRGLEGHHLGYIEALAEVAERRKIDAVALGHRSFAAAHHSAGRLRIMPSFTVQYQTSGNGGVLRAAVMTGLSCLPDRVAGAGAGLLRRGRAGLRAGAADAFGVELAAAIAGPGAAEDDILILPNVSSANLAGLPGAVPPNAVARISVVLRRTPQEMDQSEPGPAPAGALLRRLAEHFGPRLHLFADTIPLAALWRATAQVPVAVVPLPVKVPPLQANTPRTPPHLVFAGGARLEKGYQLLPGVAAALAGSVRMTIHSGEVTRRADPIIQRAHRALGAKTGPFLRLIEHGLEPDDYAALLMEADLLLLPYDPTAYGPRSSGILAEARAMAIPAIVPRGCWMEQAAGPAQEFAFDFPHGFLTSIGRAASRLGMLSEATREAATGWRTVHNPHMVLDVLLGNHPGL